MRMVPCSSFTKRSFDLNENWVFEPIRVMEVSAKVSSAMDAAAVETMEFSPILSFTLAGTAPEPSFLSTIFLTVVMSAALNSMAPKEAATQPHKKRGRLIFPRVIRPHLRPS